MDVDDALLPAAPHLTGPGARAVLAPVVEAHGGELVDVRPGQVLYRPGRDVIVSYGARIRWPSGLSEETLLAGTTRTGAPTGTVPVRADGMEVGVWRYPFDPELPGLAHATLAAPVARLLGRDAADVHLQVRAFRPGKRAVVHARWPGGEAYVKVLPPRRTGAIVARHDALLAFGLPVPAVLGADEARGLVALAALPGADLRERLVRGDGPVPAGQEVLALVDDVARAHVPPPDRDRAGLLDGAAHHAALVRRVRPESSGALDEVLGRLAAAPRPVELTTVHGDLHEAQIRVDDAGHVIGVLDVDDVGPGDPADDPARAVAHLVALGLTHPPSAGRCRALAAELHAGAVRRHGPDVVDPRVAAALVGLATGPFRAQDQDWPQGTDRLVHLALAWSRGSATGGLDERTLRSAS
ncbi:aminoglycoside phosphotransferase family protein [Actinomarinicola tropica]|uniref:Phosphotransferase n=1 Tax=Actinomarinicola tropica TaxID=2789776 RepID=A0A5Q2RIS9_9ACTN|nr:aminoglycoside phosphotransferase family protein [Actinomarinicola tropica]QGG94481.1 phosphotransferase [Actinomarinicola tropica]